MVAVRDELGVEDQLESIFGMTVQLPSAGYIVINQTEALVAIDVKLGRPMRERNVDIADETWKCRRGPAATRGDPAGLIVIDFIDMEDGQEQSRRSRRR